MLRTTAIAFLLLGCQQRLVPDAQDSSGLDDTGDADDSERFQGQGDPCTPPFADLSAHLERGPADASGAIVVNHWFGTCSNASYGEGRLMTALYDSEGIVCASTFEFLARGEPEGCDDCTVDWEVEGLPSDERFEAGCADLLPPATVTAEDFQGATQVSLDLLSVSGLVDEQRVTMAGPQTLHLAIEGGEMRVEMQWMDGPF